MLAPNVAVIQAVYQFHRHRNVLALLRYTARQYGAYTERARGLLRMVSPGLITGHSVVGCYLQLLDLRQVIDECAGNAAHQIIRVACSALVGKRQHGYRTNSIMSRRPPACSDSVDRCAGIMRRGHSARDANKKNRGANQPALPETKPEAAARSPKLVPRASNFLHQFSGVPITLFTI